MIKYRQSCSADKELLTQWISEDQYHAGTSSADFWMPQERANCFAVDDEQGPVFFVRGESILRLHIQFCPKSGWRRLAKAIDAFAAKVRNDAKAHYRQIIFESESPSLIKFLQKRGYRNSKNEYVVDL